MKEEILGIITARAGSKRLPRKNLLPLNGKPMMAYTCEAALSSKKLTRVFLSTEDTEIAEAGRSLGIDVPFLRSPELALDETTSMEVMTHVLAELQKRENYVPSVFVILQPTSPLRTAAHIDAGVELLLSTGADSVMAVTPLHKTCMPHRCKRMENGKLMSFLPTGSLTPAQQTEKLYRENGALYVFRTEVFLRSKNHYGDDCRALVMDPEHSVDIDTALDFKFAEFLLQ